MDEAFLEDRGIVEVGGEEARALLQRLVTNDVEHLRAGEARYAALLSPQGKIAVDFLVVDATPAGSPDRFLLDCPAVLAAELAKKLMLYRLRAKVTIADRSADLAVTAVWPDAPSSVGLAIRDPRRDGLGFRIVGERAGARPDPVARARYDLHRIALGVPDGGRDFSYGEAFPHDANLDRLGGVDFGKGCYVGQEVVSRVHHRGTARKRIEAVRFLGRAPAEGSEIAIGGIAIGTMGSSAEGIGLALVRIDRVAEAAAEGASAIADGVHLAIALA